MPAALSFEDSSLVKGEFLQREKENAELKIVIEKMKYEKEKLEVEKERFENKYEMEKLKSENALLKAELNVKTLSDNKRRFEEELESMKSKKKKLDEEHSKSQTEIAILKENSQKLQEKNGTLETAKNNLEKLYNEYKLEKENTLKQKKIAEGMLKAPNQRLENKQTPKKVVSSNSNVTKSKSNEITDYSRLPLRESISAGLSMIATKIVCPNYEIWYNNIMQRLGPLSDNLFKNYALVKVSCTANIQFYFDVNLHIPSLWRLKPYQLRFKSP